MSERLIPMTALVRESDVAPLRAILSDYMSDLVVPPQARLLNGWTDEQMRLGVFVHAFIEIFASGDVEIVRTGASETDPETP